MYSLICSVVEITAEIILVLILPRPEAGNIKPAQKASHCQPLLRRDTVFFGLITVDKDIIV